MKTFDENPTWWREINLFQINLKRTKRFLRKKWKSCGNRWDFFFSGEILHIFLSLLDPHVETGLVKSSVVNLWSAPRAAQQANL